MRKQRVNRRARFASLAIVLALVGVSCGTDDDDSDEEAVEEELAEEPADEPADESTEGPVDAAPTWAETPTKVRRSGLLDVADDTEFILQGSSDNSNEFGTPSDECSIRPGLVAVYVGADRVALDFDGSAPIEDDALPIGEAEDLGVLYYAVDPGDEIQWSAALRLEGVLASPVHQMFPSPGRMYFPGTLPTPSEVVVDVDDDLSSEILVSVIDTGGLGTRGARVIAEPPHIDPVGPDPDRPWVSGHGEFVAGVLLRQGTSSIVRHVRVPFDSAVDGESASNEPDVRFDENDFLRAALSPDALATPLVNLSAGFGACVAGDLELVPVVSLAIVAASFAANGRTLVAAAGNSGGDDRYAFPAAFASSDLLGSVLTGAALPTIACDDAFDATICDAVASADLRPWIDSAVELLAEPGPGGELVSDPAVAGSVVAVGASDEARAGTPDDPSDDELYSTTGGWVTSLAPGCHDSWYPAGEVTYPEFEGAPAVTVQFPESGVGGGVGAAYWCGSSFATAVVTGLLAEELASGNPQNGLKGFAEGIQL